MGVFFVPGGTAYADCGSPANAIEAENCLPGNPPSEWDVSGAGDANLQGFATDISVNRGETVSFKVTRPRPPTASTSTASATTRATGRGSSRPFRTRARSRRTSPPAWTRCRRPASSTAATGPSPPRGPSPRPRSPASTSPGSWAKPAVTGASHMVFVVRHDGGTSDLLFQTSDTTWQAYNRYGGTSLYGGSGPGTGLSGVGRAYKVSYNRPFTTRETAPEDWLFNAEYPMVRWLERNGYDVSYITGVDSDRRGSRDPRPQGLPLRRPRRVLVEAAAGERRGGARPARRARPPRLLQRQRDLLEDALGGEHRRQRHHRTARSSATRRPTRAGAEDRPLARVDGHLARPAVLAAVRRRAPRERPHRDDLHGQRRAQRQLRGPGGGREDALLAQHPERLHPRRRPGLVGADRHARVRVGRGPRQRLPARGARTALDDDDQRRDRGHQDYGSTYAPGRPRTTWSSTSGRTALSCSAPGRSSGRGGSTATTTGAARPRASTCSRPR